jgi:alkanesulfonate monooxygenase SsuD/methylene tetrahydromethanopterin reductase-like flavin-dependent oxidoreductase (luciferase family)
LVDVGHLIFCTSDGYASMTDGQAVAEEMRLARLCDELGFDVVWCVEHHFEGYSMVPNNLQLLAHVAAITSSVDVGAAAVILPWHDPLRVAEEIAMLDHLARGRVRIGFGRGASRKEFGGFREGAMEESRERFDEAADIVVRALKSGVVEGQGRFYKQPRIEIRPRPERSFTGRIYVVAGSDDSIESAARLGARMMMTADKSWRTRMDSINHYRKLYEEINGEPAPRPLTTDYTLCWPDAAEAEELARDHLARLVDSTFDHYETTGEHFEGVKGYEQRAATAAAVRKIGREGFLEKVFLGATTWGTPDQILERLKYRHDMLGGFEISTSFRFGGLPFEVAEKSMRLYAAEVLPVLHTW